MQLPRYPAVFKSTEAGSKSLRTGVYFRIIDFKYLNILNIDFVALGSLAMFAVFEMTPLKAGQALG